MGDLLSLLFEEKPAQTKKPTPTAHAAQSVGFLLMEGRSA
jgi:hypothetical protein